MIDEALIKDSDEYKNFMNIPKALRPRMTKKQVAKAIKPDILSEGLAL